MDSDLLEIHGVMASPKGHRLDSTLAIVPAAAASRQETAMAMVPSTHAICAESPAKKNES